MSLEVLVSSPDIPTGDGALLATDVIRAADGVPRPVLLVRTPYGRAALRQGLDPVALARTGWAVVLQDIRGRWDSGGEYRPWHQDGPDGAAMVAWCRAQPWCDGSVVMQGASYDGVTAWLAAASLPDGLAAIAPTVSTADILDPLITTNGTLNLGLLANWGLGHVTVGNPASRPEEIVEAVTLLGDWAGSVEREDVLERLAACVPVSREWLAAWRSGARLAPWPEPLDGTPLARDGLPVYQLTGWFDSFVEGALRAYAALLRTPARASQRLVIGPWSHGTVLATSCGALEFGPSASGWDRFPAEQQQFLREAADGGTPSGGATVWVVGGDGWAELEQWPPPIRCVRWSAYAETSRSARWQTEVPDAVGQLVWEHEDATPVPTIGGRTLHPNPPAPPGPMDRASLTARDDVVSIVSEPLEEDLTIMGEPAVELSLTSSTSVTDLHVHLVDIEPGGAAIGIVGQAHRLPTEPGQSQRHRLGTGTIAACIRAGHRLGLQIASSDFPAHDVTPRGRRSIATGGEHPLRLELPVWDGTSGVRVSP